jgi:hypothetical protein
MSKMWILGVVLAACSSSSSPGSVSGPIKGKTFVVNDAFAIADAVGVEIVLDSATDDCVPPAQQVQHPNETALLILLSDYDPATQRATAPSAPGSYAISSGGMLAHNAVVEANIVDAACMNDASNDAVASTGAVQLTSVSGGTFKGTFDVLMDSGDHVTGAFDTPTCTEQRNPDPACTPAL